MATKKAKQESPEGILTSAAKTIGTAAGKIAAAVGMTPDPEPKPKRAAGKYKAPAVKKAKKAVKKAAKKSTAVPTASAEAK